MRTLTKWTVSEYHDMIDKGVLDHKRVELLNGELVEMAPEKPIHRYIMRHGQKYLERIFSGHALLQEGHPITLRNSEPEPDIVIFKKPEEAYYTRHPHAEDIFLVIEVSNSTLSYDLGEKKQIYAGEGICEYWVIDVKHNQLHVFKDLIDNKYQTNQVFKKGEIALKSFPEILISIEKIIQGR